VVEILLEREEVNPDKPDNNGKTPLSYAAWERHEGLVKILLRRKEVNPDKTDILGQTPLSHAAQNRHGRVVALLQSCKVATPVQSKAQEIRSLLIAPAPFLSGHVTPGDAFGGHPLQIGGLPRDGRAYMSHNILRLFGYLFPWLGGVF